MEETFSINCSRWARSDPSQTEPVTAKPLACHSRKHLSSSASFREQVCTVEPSPASSSTTAYLQRIREKTASYSDMGSSSTKKEYIEKVQSEPDSWKRKQKKVKEKGNASDRDTRFHECHRCRERSCLWETIRSCWNRHFPPPWKDIPWWGWVTCYNVYRFFADLDILIT